MFHKFQRAAHARTSAFGRWIVAPVLACSLAFFGCANAAAMEPKLVKGEEVKLTFFTIYFFTLSFQQSSCSRRGLTASQCVSETSSCNIFLMAIQSALDDHAMYGKKAVADCSGAMFVLSLAYQNSTIGPCQLAIVNSACMYSLKKYSPEDRATYLGENVDK